MHTVCFSKLLSGFTGFLTAGKKPVHQLLDKKKSPKTSSLTLKVHQIWKKTRFQDSDYNPHSYFHNLKKKLKVHNISTLIDD